MYSSNDNGYADQVLGHIYSLNKIIEVDVD